MRNWFKRIFQVTYMRLRRPDPSETFKERFSRPPPLVMLKARCVVQTQTLSLWQTACVCECVGSPRLLGFECVLVEVSVVSWKTCQSQMSPRSQRQDHINPGHLVTKARNRLSELGRSLLPAEDERGRTRTGNGLELMHNVCGQLSKLMV